MSVLLNQYRRHVPNALHRQPKPSITVSRPEPWTSHHPSPSPTSHFGIRPYHCEDRDDNSRRTERVTPLQQGRSFGGEPPIHIFIASRTAGTKGRRKISAEERASILEMKKHTCTSV
ncbi:MAG: hypothetical protein Q9187_005338 [Circinaria calcarea]